VGDVEYRGQGFARASGACSGFVDARTYLDAGIDETPALPYVWR
jgi:hypothetical protein